ncbi:SprT family zinc-dependent metalloprotease [uncultured Kushneria sp.]|uniref:M48 family metallopeptidase n=1 Tax=uncultured Kushneria sp. TaxID=905033 RepID=UPI002631FD30|nr:SprT family zinc-dependent metalloprotease [uncultured Kushneria sp.]
MNTEIEVSGIRVDIHRKPIKNLHVGVYPPDGRVRVAAPERLDDEAVRLAIVSRLSWIRRQRRGFIEQTRESAREMVTGESHYFRGRRYRLNVLEQRTPPDVRIAGRHTLELRVPPDSETRYRRNVLERWHRDQLYQAIPDLIETWSPIVGVEVAECRVKRMKTHWGSCNIAARRIWLNLELIRKPPKCLEYIFVHEMVHLLERHHNERFRRLMDTFMPDWRLRKDELNKAPLAHEKWDY